MKKLLLIFTTFATFATFANAQTIADIKKVDFTNFAFQINKESVKMENGLQDKACEEKDPEGIPSGDIWSISADAIAYGDLDGDGKDEAIVPMIANICGGNMVTDEAVLVYTVKKGKLTLFPIFEYFDEACPQISKGCTFDRSPGVSVSYDAQKKSIIVETSFSTGDDAICCPSFYRQIWYKWNGKAFVESKKGQILKRKETN